MNKIVYVYVDFSYCEKRKLIYNTIQQLLEVAGWLTELTDDLLSANIVYSPEYKNDCWICTPYSTWNQSYTNSFFNANILTLEEIHNLKNLKSSIDWIFIGYYFLSGAFESHSKESNNINLIESIISSSGIDAVPVVNYCSNKLNKYLLSQNITFKPAPKWPNNKKWALCLSHDCDRFFKYRTLNFLKDSKHFLTKKKLSHAINYSLKAISSSFLNITNCTDPYFNSWLQWLEFQEKHSISATYFISTFNRYENGSTFLDVDYDFSDYRILNQVKLFHDKGFDFGLHTTTGAWESKRYKDEAERFTSYYGFSPTGYRGHYWSLSPENPSLTMDLVSKDTCLKYSSSFGMNKTHGYRRGVCYPYRPYDYLTGEYTGNYEIPPIIMDQSLFYSGKNNSDRMKEFDRKVGEIASQNGCLVLDWHTDSLSANYMDNLTRDLLIELTKLVNDSDCWVTSMVNVFNWCRNDRWIDF